MPRRILRKPTKTGLMVNGGVVATELLKQEDGLVEGTFIRRSSTGGMTRFQLSRISSLQSTTELVSVDSLTVDDGGIRRSASLVLDDAVVSTHHQRGDGSILTIESTKSRSFRTPSTGSSVSRDSIVCCLQGSVDSKTPLRQQILFRFGVMSFIVIAVIVSAAVWTTVEAQNNTVRVGGDNVDAWVQSKLGFTSHFLADIVSQRLYNFEGVLALIQTMTQERLAGYPLIEDDSRVPFMNELNGDGEPQRQYPWKAAKKLPFQHDFIPNVNGSNAKEHLGPWRYDWLKGQDLSTAHAMMSVSLSDFEATTATPTFRILYNKVSDFCSPVLKPIYEQQTLIKSMEIHFVNHGVGGASAVYPSQSNWTMNNAPSENTVGCDWLHYPNPFDPSRPIGDYEMRQNCANSNKFNNILRQDFCRLQALNPFQHQVEGPTLEGGRWVVRFGKAIYDTYTHELIACLTLVVDGTALGYVDMDSSFRLVQEEEKRIALIRWDDLSVIYGTDARGAATERTKTVASLTPLHIDKLDMGADDELLVEMKEQFLEEYRKNGDIRKIHNHFIRGKWYVSSYPSPPPPNNTDVEWRPEFLTVNALGVEYRDYHLELLRDEMQPKTRRLIWQILGAGAASFVLIMIIIYVVSLFLTLPLEWMYGVGTDILESAGTVAATEQSKDLNDDNDSRASKKLELSRRTGWWYRFSPNTEVTQLVDKFDEMVQQFAGQGTAKLFKQQMLEVKNPFSLINNFKSLYDRRNQKRASYVYTPKVDKLISLPPLGVSPEAPLTMFRSPSTQKMMDSPRINEGPNVHALDSDDLDHDSYNPSELERSHSSARSRSKLRRAAFHSMLFWWIVGSIVVPLVIAMVAIAVFVDYDVAATLPSLVAVTGQMYAELEREFLIPFARLRAAYISEVISTTERDLHIFNRIAGWLLTGAVGLADDTFIKLAMASETCKEYHPFNNVCPLHEARKATCDCGWEDPWGTQQCNATAGINQRINQIVAFEGLREDAYPNGERNSSSFPNVASSPVEVQFWSTVESLPGYNSSVTGVLDDTTFSRARVAAALSAIQIPLYNYAQQEIPHLKRTWGSYLALDKAGSYSSYAGCNFWHSYHAQVRFGNNTGHDAQVKYGQEIPTHNEKLCPPGKFGFDPRCTDWYALGKEHAFDMTKSPLVMMPPTRITASDPEPQVQVTLPLVDTRTNELLGQTMIRFSEDALLETLSDEWTPLGFGSFHVMTTAGVDAKKEDVLIAPGFKFGNKPVPIAEIMLPEDTCEDSDSNSNGESCHNLHEFDKIVNDMHEGGTALKSFRRISSETGEPEWVTLTYAPVTVQSYRPIDPSDFSRGVEAFTTDLYSVALGETEVGIAQHFETDLSFLEKGLEQFVVVLTIVIFFVFLFLLIASGWISLTCSLPVVELSRIVSTINRSNNTGMVLPRIYGGSRELSKLRSTFELLYSVLQVANMAFFLGNHDKAFTTMHDALMLFTKLKNKKAIGIANNNLGNLMLAMYRAMKKISCPTLCGFSRKRIIQKGSTYFSNAIDLGEDALKQIYENEGFSEKYLIFMQQLSNRYFNRAIFLLTVAQDHSDPEKAEQQGLVDLITCKDMDREVVDNGDREGFKGDQDVYFELLMGRIKGLLMLLKLGYEDEWGIDDIFVEARDQLQEALNVPDHSLFDHLDPAGQMQRLDSALIEYHLYVAGKLTDDNEKSNRINKAAEIAIRMLVEDDYVIAEAAMLALKALIESTHFSSEEEYGEDPSDIRAKLFQYRHKIGEILSLSYSSKALVGRECLNASNSGDFSMEVF